MVMQAFEITLLGMGSVFFFLYLMTEVMRLITLCLPKVEPNSLKKSIQSETEPIAVALAVARQKINQAGE